MKFNFVILVSLLISSCTSEIKQASAEDMPLEQRLGILDAKGFIDTSDIKVIRMKVLLNKLATSYGEPKDSIAEWTSKAQGALHDEGIEVANLEILEEVNRMGQIENSKYREVVTLYATLRSQNN